MTFTKTIMSSVAALAIAGSTGFAMAQATSTENNATSGSTSPDTKMKSSGSEMKGSSGMSDKGMSGGDTPTSAGTKDSQAKDLRGHSETPTTGK